MDQYKNKRIAEHLQMIAKREGISESEVRNEIAMAVSIALKSSDPRIQEFWQNIPCEGDAPTIEEIIDHIASGIASS